jgi:hypothetical protein
LKEGVTFAQLFQQLKGSSWHGLRVLAGLAQNTPDISQDSAVAPVLLTYTSPGLLACCRKNSGTTAGGMAQQGSMSKTLEGLQQLLQQPEVDAVLGPAVRQQRLADVSMTLQELQAASSISSQLQLAATYGEDVGPVGDPVSLHCSGTMQAAWQQPQQQQLQPLSPTASAAAAATGVVSRMLGATSLVPLRSGQLQAAAHSNGSHRVMPRPPVQSAPAAAAVTDAGLGMTLLLLRLLGTA